MEKKLQEMENIQEKLNVEPLNDNYHDILEFAENYFNAHERSPEGLKNFLYFCYLIAHPCYTTVPVIIAIYVACTP